MPLTILSEVFLKSSFFFSNIKKMSTELGAVKYILWLGPLYLG